MFHNTEADYCHECLGVWFDKNELGYAVHDKDQELNWLDIDLWRDKAKFKVSNSSRRCPVCNITMAQVGYDDSSVQVDFCKMCGGIWLDRGEFKKIMAYLEQKADYEILHHYTKHLIQQLWEVFTGPKPLREELHDFLTLIKLLNYKFVAQHPHLEQMMEELPK